MEFSSRWDSWWDTTNASSHSVPSTEVVTSPPVIPPTVNPPPESAPVTPQESAAGHAALNPAPETEVMPPGGPELIPLPPRRSQPRLCLRTATPGSGQAGLNPPSPPTPAAGEVGEGITLQVAALRTKQDAEALVDILKTRGYPVFLVTPEYAHADDNLFRVQVGPSGLATTPIRCATNLPRKDSNPSSGTERFWHF